MIHMKSIEVGISKLCPTHGSSAGLQREHLVKQGDDGVEWGS